MTSIFPSGHRAAEVIPLPTLTAELHKVVTKDYDILLFLDEQRATTTAEVRDAYTLVIKDLIWKLHQNYYKVQNQLVEQTLEWEHRASEHPIYNPPRPFSPHTPQYADVPSAPILPPPTELERQ